MWQKLLRKQTNIGTSTADCRNTLIYAHTTSRIFPACDISLSSLTLPAPETGDFVELLLLYTGMTASISVSRHWPTPPPPPKKKRIFYGAFSHSIAQPQWKQLLKQCEGQTRTVASSSSPASRTGYAMNAASMDWPPPTCCPLRYEEKRNTW
jgi:hypothetical protein